MTRPYKSLDERIREETRVEGILSASNEYRAMDPLKDALKEFWNTRFWNRPLRLLVAAVIVAPLGGVVVSPVFVGRAAQVYAQRAGRKHSDALGVAFGVLWFAVIFGPLYVWYYWFAGP